MRDVVVLCYHAVSPRWDAGLSITPAALERQIGHLVARGWRATTFSDAILGDASAPVLSVTFDDAFASVRDYARPILSRHGVPATVFAPTDFIDAGRDLEWPGVEHWKRTGFAHELAPMGWSDLRELAALGWEIGSHTCTHPRLTTLDDETLASELARSRARCLSELGSCRSIAYPYGDVNPRVAAAAAQAG
ncbi:MAG: polysaccharide deacetylase family protein, partial [Solirubrobacteraceae bacterium]